ncbi:dihydroorotase [Halobacterium sp. CBA1126]|uniref:dihydroorotase n=1 Tax=Halobacterium sp. CBA1126 TaxID=2668074 RepID=UPI0012FA4CC4|nr:dihydroorotase [Halobacterium sp. CBA1126]MUV59723.1 dihydroorotase [Halobacterium sp. CBA1126]
MRVIRNATLADGRVRDVRIGDGRIDAVGEDLEGETLADATGKRLLPGMIDAHVHFRQPGYEHKETWASGSRSAAAGGVTTVVDQPNTDPPTVTGAAFDEKAEYAADSLVDWGVNGGVTADWDPGSLFDRPLFALGEVFLADSTGDMGIDAELFADACERAAEEDVVVTVHAEDADLFAESVPPSGTDTASGDEPRADAKSRDDADAWSAYRTAEAEEAAVERAVGVGGNVGATVHVAHTSTPEGVDAARAGGATCEVTPHHLFLSREDLDELGTFGRMNPPLRSEERREALFERLADGKVDVVATDHAPHTREEKDASIWDAPSGVPGVETALPLLVQAASEGELSFERVRDVTAANPADVFDLPRKGRIEEGRDADLVLVDPDASREIRGGDLHSKCGWTPFEGMAGVFPELTLVRGTVVWDGEGFADHDGENVRA